MGYKLAGCDVLGCVEIDPKMNDIYCNNHKPKFNYRMDMRDFNQIPDDELPKELFNLDILDGSPPCTTFSISGLREESWGKKKKFREGQKEQTLDDLSFVFIETVKKLRPKIVVMENVEGLLLGEAWSYLQRIYSEFMDAGYFVHHWLLKGEQMGVPQTRHRVFFVATRADLNIDPSWLDMSFNYEPVTFGEIKSDRGHKLSDGHIKRLVEKIQYGDLDLSDACLREEGKESFFNYMILYDDKVCKTIPGKNCLIRFDTREWIGIQDIINAQTFPQDYDFGTRTYSNVSFICGMSVPPVMMKRVVTRLIEQGVFDYKQKEMKPC